MTNPWPPETLQGFQQAAQSLKLYRRAELQDLEQGGSLVEELYVDPLPADNAFQTVLSPHTTFVIGRKGTGKSTIFQRLQYELRKSKYQTSAYLDIKTVYESSQVDPELLARVQELDAALPAASLERLLLYREFLRAVVTEIKSELTKRIQASIWEKVKEHFSGNIAELFEGLDTLLEEANEDRFINIIGLRSADRKAKKSAAKRASTKAGAAGELGTAPKASATVERTSESSAADENEVEYTDILLRSFNIKEIVARLREILDQLGIRYLYVLVDDFSELPEEAMRVVVDVLLAPLNNWSDEFIKFKIAAYPGRVYFGAIDKTKVDELYLDMYRLYGGGDVGRMEDSAIDFTKRLVERRIQHFCNRDAADFFENPDAEVWQHLFYASMANPRSLGYLLHYLYESHLIRGRRISVSAIQEAAQRYYAEKIESYFTIGKFLHESFEERSSIFSLKELLEALVTRARELRSQGGSDLIRKISGRPPTSHFHVPVAYEPLFSSLELNFFLTKYFEMTDRSSRKVSVYALNYGLCSKYTIRFGRPTGEREFRTYFIERGFDYSPILLAYLAKNQEIVCDACRATYAFENLDALKFYGMRCRECKDGTVRVTNLSRKYADELRAVSQDALLPATELGILQTLHAEDGPIRAAQIAGELDCSYQLVGKRGKALAERGLVTRTMAGGFRLFEIAKLATTAYFSNPARNDLQMESEPPSSGTAE
ncbi:MAG: hypothetical protein V4550_20190 [Gemmatimonadota bacterium]